MSEQTQEALVDTSSVVRPAQHERQKSLEKLYADRPTAHELKERHILLDTDAAPYVFLSFFSYDLPSPYSPILLSCSSSLLANALIAG